MAGSVPIGAAGRHDWWQRLRQAVPHGRGLPEEEWNRRHRGLLIVLWLNAIALPIFAIAQGYGLIHALAETAIVAFFGLLAIPHRFGRNIRMACVSAGLLSASALAVHFSGGYIEFHFHFFVMIALLALYQHWLPFLIAIGYVALHHGIGGVIDPGAVYNHQDGIDKPWKWAGIHAGFVLSAAAANVFAWRYFEEEQARRRDLLRVTEAALGQLPLPRLLDEVLLRVSEVLRADTTTISLWEEDGALTIRSARGALGDYTGEPITADNLIASRIAERRKPVVLHEVDFTTLANPVHHERRVRSLAAVPLLVAGEVIGVLDVGTVADRRFSHSDVELLGLAADRIAPAIDRARSHDRDHGIAVTLQRSLLPKELPQIPGIEIAFQYQPAGERLEAGGDWYDAFTLPSGRLGIAMGDVVGRGTEAASLMGQLRTGLRAYAKDGHEPAASVARLDVLARDLSSQNMATLFYGELDPETMLLRYANAGHPPALLLGPEGQTEYLEQARTTPIGVPAGRPTQAEASIEPGSKLVLYTDGLVESRTSGLDEGLALLDSIVTEHVNSTPTSMCAVVMERVSPVACGDDDVAVMVVGFTPVLGETLDIELPAVPDSASEMRAALERWLGEKDVPQATLFDIVLACSEAAANAIEHAYGPGDDRFHLSAAQINGRVEVEVADDGQWRMPRGHDRGRGLTLMRELMDDVEVVRGEQGTTVRMSREV